MPRLWGYKSIDFTDARPFRRGLGNESSILRNHLSRIFIDGRTRCFHHPCREETLFFGIPFYTLRVKTSHSYSSPIWCFYGTYFFTFNNFFCRCHRRIPALGVPSVFKRTKISQMAQWIKVDVFLRIFCVLVFVERFS